jgi:drug/metabolite transporter (DMT)-like permease
MYTAFLLLFRHSGRGQRQPAGQLLDATVGAAVVGFLLGVLTDPGFSLAWSWPAHGWLLALAVGSQTIAWWGILTVLPRLPALDTSVLLLIQPMLTVVWGWMLFAENLSSLQWAGVASVLIGVAVVVVGGAVARSRAVAVPLR